MTRYTPERLREMADEMQRSADVFSEIAEQAGRSPSDHATVAQIRDGNAQVATALRQAATDAERIAELEAQLAEARGRAIEDAAAVCDEIAKAPSLWSVTLATVAAQDAADKCARSIRALAPAQPAEGEQKQ